MYAGKSKSGNKNWGDLEDDILEKDSEDPEENDEDPKEKDEEDDKLQEGNKISASVSLSNADDL
jgi:hypothetical protein